MLFTTTDKQGSIKLQTVRLDGQGLQTLYCTTKPGLDSLQWSPTQQFVAFNDGGPGNAQTSISLLNLATGTLQIEVPLSLNQSTLVRTWADKTRVYLTDTPVNGLFTTIYLLDTSKGAGQPLSSLTVVAHGSFTDFDSTPEGTQLFTVTNSCRTGTCTTPNSIDAMPITGGPAHPILTSKTYAIEQVRAIGKNKLLFLVIDSLKGENGLWMMNTDGTGRLHLTTDSVAAPTFQWSSLNLSSQYSWSNVSRDGTRYALLTGHPGGGNTAYTLLYGNLIGGTPLAFASAPNGNDLMPEIAGWTTL